MGFGVANEYIAYAIAELARNEVRKYLTNQGSQIINQYIVESSGGYGQDSGTQVSKDWRIISSVLATLESNNFDLRLLKDDPTHPNRLTGVIISFEENVTQLIELNRAGGKLSEIIISVFIKEDTMYDIQNPFNMPANVFSKYMFNKYSIEYYTEVITNPDSTGEEISEAMQKREEADIENQNLRSLYGVLTDAYTYDMLVQFLPNPLGMPESDFITYVLNKKIFKLYSEGLDIPEQVRTSAMEQNAELRNNYLIKNDIFSYDMIKEYLPNPLGMSTEDFIAYYRIKENNLTVEDPELILESEQPYRDKYYISDEEDITVEEMAEYVNQALKAQDGRLLFKIQVSLNYLQGKLNSVSSSLNIQE